MAESEGKLRDLESLRIARATHVETRRSALPMLAGVVGLLVALITAYLIYSRTIGRPPEVEVTSVTIKGGSQSGVMLTGSGYIITRDKYITIGTKILGQ